MSDEKKYKINEIFYSLQGEGIRTGTANIFVRFSNCNMKCAEEAGPKSPGGFDCDTEFESGRMLTLEEVENDILDLLEEYDDDGELAAARKCTELVPEAKISVKDKWMILTGGEPGLQANPEFCIYFRSRGWKLAIETNGSLLVAHTAGAYRHEHSLKTIANYLTRYGRYETLKLFYFDWITVSPKVAEHAIRQPVAHEVKYVRGHGQALPKTVVDAKYRLISPAFNGLSVDRKALDWCLKLVKENPTWRLSPQMHKLWKAR